MATEKREAEAFSKDENKILVNSLDVYAKQLERTRSKEEVGSDIYDIRTKQIAAVRNLAMKVQTGVLL